MRRTVEHSANSPGVAVALVLLALTSRPVPSRPRAARRRWPAAAGAAPAAAPSPSQARHAAGGGRPGASAVCRGWPSTRRSGRWAGRQRRHPACRGWSGWTSRLGPALRCHARRRSRAVGLAPGLPRRRAGPRSTWKSLARVARRLVRGDQRGPHRPRGRGASAARADRRRRDGVVTEVVRPPRALHHRSRPTGTRGVRHNLGLESLTRTPDGRLLSGLEQPLVQDGPLDERHARRRGAPGGVRAAGAGGVGAGPRVGRIGWSRRPAMAGYDRVCEDGENGLSAISCALDDTTAPRGRARVPARRGGRAGVQPGAAVRGRRSTAPTTSRSHRRRWRGVGRAPVRKRLVLDLATLIPQLPPALRDRSRTSRASPLGPPGPTANAR